MYFQIVQSFKQIFQQKIFGPTNKGGNGKYAEIWNIPETIIRSRSQACVQNDRGKNTKTYERKIWRVDACENDPGGDGMMWKKIWDLWWWGYEEQKLTIEKTMAGNCGMGQVCSAIEESLLSENITHKEALCFFYSTWCGWSHFNFRNCQYIDYRSAFSFFSITDIIFKISSGVHTSVIWSTQRRKFLVRYFPW